MVAIATLVGRANVGPELLREGPGIVVLSRGSRVARGGIPRRRLLILSRWGPTRGTRSDQRDECEGGGTCERARPCTDVVDTIHEVLPGHGARSSRSRDRAVDGSFFEHLLQVVARF